MHDNPISFLWKMKGKYLFKQMRHLAVLNTSKRVKQTGRSLSIKGVFRLNAK